MLYSEIEEMKKIIDEFLTHGIDAIEDKVDFWINMCHENPDISCYFFFKDFLVAYVQPGEAICQIYVLRGKKHAEMLKRMLESIAEFLNYTYVPEFIFEELERLEHYECDNCDEEVSEEVSNVSR